MISHVKRIWARIARVKERYSCADTGDRGTVVMVYKAGTIIYHDFGRGQP